MFFRIYWYIVIFFLCFVNVVYHIDLFVDREPYLHPWNKSHLIMMYDFFFCHFCPSFRASPMAYGGSQARSPTGAGAVIMFEIFLISWVRSVSIKTFLLELLLLCSRDFGKPCFYFICLKVFSHFPFYFFINSLFFVFFSVACCLVSTCTHVCVFPFFLPVIDF